jgi:hypothetical protein
VTLTDTTDLLHQEELARTDEQTVDLVDRYTYAGLCELRRALEHADARAIPPHVRELLEAAVELAESAFVDVDSEEPF